MLFRVKLFSMEIKEYKHLQKYLSIYRNEIYGLSEF